MVQSPSGHRAFTLIELLVVIAIIGVLMALMLPAIQKIRSTAERIRCSNQMRQIGVALIRHHDERGALPMGVTPDLISVKPNLKRSEHPFMTWLTRLLPFIEQEALWQQAMGDYRLQRNPFWQNPKKFNTAISHPTLGATVDLFFCPADPRDSGPHVTRRDRLVGSTSYVGVNGTTHRAYNGVLYRASATHFGDISDGTAQTLMAGERPPSGDYWYGWWYACVGMNGTGAPDALLGTREIRTTSATFTNDCVPGPYHYETGTLDDVCSVFHFWSFHSGGSNFLMCDGSVHFLTYSADSILPALATRCGGEEAAVPD